MMKNNISKIIKKYLSGRFSPATEERVQRWLIKDESTEDKESASLEYWESLEILPNSGTYSALERVNKRIGQTSKQKSKTLLLRKLSRVAAILIPLFIAIGGYVYYQSSQENMAEIFVAYGEEKHIFLPDSSEVWINAGSTLKYPEKFKGNERRVELDGEAYFSVRRDESRNFVVHTDQLSVNVLGTKFNVKAYSSEERVTTTLTSGKVEVKSGTQTQILKPNEQLTYNRNTSLIQVEEISPNETNGWLTGQLIFNNSSLEEVLRTLERRFDVSMVNNSTIAITKLYTVKFLKGESLNEILNILGDMMDFGYQKQGKQIIISNAN